jgi:hypothetical protein
MLPGSKSLALTVFDEDAQVPLDDEHEGSRARR